MSAPFLGMYNICVQGGTHTYTHTHTKKNTPGIIFWRAGLLYCRFPLLAEYSKNPSVAVCQLVVLWEAAFSFSDFFFLKTLSTHWPISWWVIYKHTCPQCVECSAVFDQKQHDPHAPPSLFTRSVPKWLYFVPLDFKKSSKENVLPMWKRWKKKTAEALKGIKIDKFRNCFEPWEKHLHRCVVLNTPINTGTPSKDTLKVTEV